MVIAKTLIKNRAQLGGSPSEVLAYANEQLCEGNDAELFVTVWLAIIEISTGRGIAANAGHEHPALMRANGEFELVKYRHSPAVATFPGLTFKEHEFELNPGDKLFVYTDGVTEATDSSNVLFGEERLVASLNSGKDFTPDKLIENVKSDIDRFVGDAPQFDDITMLSISWNKKQ
jgi:sigma-B regulation protein RsbU (phosphoserine phosphatase)